MPTEGSSTDRGYGYEHRKLREAALAELREEPGRPCPRCGEPMWPDEQELDLGHRDDRSGYNGLEHLSCNRRAGAIKGNAMRAAQGGSGRW